MIQGGVPLSGEVTAAGNKNAALPILAACLLTDEELVLSNVPRIRDTEAQVAILERLGVKASWGSDDVLHLQADSVTDTSPDEELSAAIRASFLLAGPLLARFGEARMPPPGGDFIGRRRLDPHLDAFTDMGAKISGSRWIEITANGGLKPCAVFMDEPSVMGTENALMAAALTEGPTTISNAASEPHVQDLAHLLVKMGATIDGIGSNSMTVHGRDKLGGAEHRVSPDHIEVVSFVALAAATGGDLVIRDAEPADLRMVARAFSRLGLRLEMDGQRRPRPGRPGAGRPRRHGRRDPEDRGRPLARLPGRPDLDRPRPRHPGQGNHPDLREDVREPLVLRRQARCHGRSDHALRSPSGDRQRSEPASRRSRREPRHPRRDGDAHRRAVRRRASEIGNITQIDRGYEKIDQRLRELGAKIERVSVDRIPA